MPSFAYALTMRATDCEEKVVNIGGLVAMSARRSKRRSNLLYEPGAAFACLVHDSELRAKAFAILPMLCSSKASAGRFMHTSHSCRKSAWSRQLARAKALANIATDCAEKARPAYPRACTPIQRNVSTSYTSVLQRALARRARERGPEASPDDGIDMFRASFVRCARRCGGA